MSLMTVHVRPEKCHGSSGFRGLDLSLVSEANSLPRSGLPHSCVVPRIHRVQLIVNQAFVVTLDLGEDSDEEASCVLVMRIETHASSEVQGVKMLRRIFFQCVNVSVSFTEHSLLDLLLRPARHVFVKSEPLRCVPLASSIMEHLPSSKARSVLETRGNFSGHVQ